MISYQYLSLNVAISIKKYINKILQSEGECIFEKWWSSYLVGNCIRLTQPSPAPVAIDYPSSEIATQTDAN